MSTATVAERAWISSAIDANGLWLQLGWPTPFGASIAELIEQGSVWAGAVRTVPVSGGASPPAGLQSLRSLRTVPVSGGASPQATHPLGFALLFPMADPEKRELIQATPRPEDRNAFTALNAFDAILYAAFEVFGLKGLTLRIRKDNPQPLAILRRVGIEPNFEVPLLGSTYLYTEIDQRRWEQRLAKLKARDPEPFSRGADAEEG
ncbi:MAG: hypothetical protein U1E65_17350 [Myxococcota bacterium]